MTSQAKLFQWRKMIASESGPQPTTRHILLTLSIHMNEAGGSCYPSIRTLAGETGLSTRTICTHLEAAERGGWISRRMRQPGNEGGRSGQGWRRHQYSLSFPEKVLKEVQRVSSEGVETDSTRKAKGVEPLSKGVEPNDIKVLKEVQLRSSSRSSKRSSGPQKHKTPLPQNYKPTDRHIDYAKSKGIPENQIEDLFEGFCIHHRKVGSKFVDWYAAWQTWVRNEIKFARERSQRAMGNQGGQQPAEPLTLEEIEAMTNAN